AFQNITNSLGEDDKKVAALSLPSQTDEIREMMDEQVFDEPIRNRGLKLVTFVVESVTLTEESKDKIDNYEFGSDVYEQKAKLTDSYAKAIENAASNEAGAFNGFMGIGVANMSMGNPLDILKTGNAENISIDPKTAEPVKQNETPITQDVVTEQKNNANNWVCDCGYENHGNFCMKCGAKKKIEEPQEVECPICKIKYPKGTNFCGNCGTRLN
ncbi:MAG: hypothetical protein ACI4VQ_05350, partial [Clostridia bacterium]